MDPRTWMKLSPVHSACAGLEALRWGREEVAEVIAWTGCDVAPPSPRARGTCPWHPPPRTPKNIICNADEGNPGAWLTMTMECDPHAKAVDNRRLGGRVPTTATSTVRGVPARPCRAREKKAEQAAQQGHPRQERAGQRLVLLDMQVRARRRRVPSAAKSSTSWPNHRGRARYAKDQAAPFQASASSREGSNVDNVRKYPHGHLGHALRRRRVEDDGHGAQETPGSKMFCISGNANRVGCFELPPSARHCDSFSRNLAAAALPELKAIQVGGPLPPASRRLLLDLGMEPEEVYRNKTRLPRGRRLRLHGPGRLRHQHASALVPPRTRAAGVAPPATANTRRR